MKLKTYVSNSNGVNSNQIELNKLEVFYLFQTPTE